MSYYDDTDALNEAVAYEQERAAEADYEAELAISQHLSDRELAEAEYPTGSDW